MIRVLLVRIVWFKGEDSQIRGFSAALFLQEASMIQYLVEVKNDQVV
jgi:hypothetical protein